MFCKTLFYNHRWFLSIYIKWCSPYPNLIESFFFPFSKFLFSSFLLFAAALLRLLSINGVTWIVQAVQLLQNLWRHSVFLIHLSSRQLCLPCSLPFVPGIVWWEMWKCFLKKKYEFLLPCYGINKKIHEAGSLRRAEQREERLRAFRGLHVQGVDWGTGTSRKNTKQKKPTLAW